ncbi:hypothetical protein RI129_002930 [Pyrocoelia pectoralis]|uniref:DUF7869 domain-containing protein n=1 Tax=Pyrocoelia pectoralis TaxID=417401 RepID=A0AAN7ZUD1_9COLE
MYLADTDPKYKVSYPYFHKIFSCHFNLGFGTPATDTCSYCERTKNKIKFATNVDVKRGYQRDLTIHKFRGKQFYLLMKDNPENTLNLCFDLQQVHNLPKLPIQEAYYSLQLAFYAFCIVNVTTNVPTFYTWNETQSGRGSNEIGSAVFHFLKTAPIEGNIKKIRVFCDGCGGQNKNSHVLHMFMYWLYHHSPQSVDGIQLIFPVRGHSYLPADRIFGRIEKELRRHERIIFPEDYVKFYSKVGSVREAGKDWDVYNLKSLLNTFKKFQGISDKKRICIIKNKTSNNKKEIVAENCLLVRRWERIKLNNFVNGSVVYY